MGLVEIESERSGAYAMGLVESERSGAYAYTLHWYNCTCTWVSIHVVGYHYFAWVVCGCECGCGPHILRQGKS